MFRDSEIIGMLNGLSKKIDCLCAESDDDVFRKLADIEDECQEIQNKLNVIEENCLRDDEEFRYQIRLALEEYMESQIPKKKKEPKKVEKKVSKKK